MTEDGVAEQKMKNENSKGEEGEEQITIKIKQQGHAEIQFKIKKKTKMGKVMNAFCQKEGLATSEGAGGKTLYPLRFLFDGARIKADDTALDLGIHDEDMIDAMVEQVGGAAGDGDQKVNGS